MDIQRLRNITTGIIHTSSNDIRQDVAYIIGEHDIRAYMLLGMCYALTTYLQKFLPEKFWEKTYDPTHTGEVDVPPMNEQEKLQFWESYKKIFQEAGGKF